MPDMLVKLYDIPSGTPYLEALQAAGITVRTARAYEKHQVLAWVRRTFGSGWASECDVAFSNHPISCFLAVEDDAIIGFACYESTWKNFFGPWGSLNMPVAVGSAQPSSWPASMPWLLNGYAYAIIGNAGAPAFYAKTAGAIPIEGSEPGVYRGRLQE